MLEWVIFLWIFLEILHHFWSIEIVLEIDRIYANVLLDRKVDIVDLPMSPEFEKYWSVCSKGQKACFSQWALPTGKTVEEHVSGATHKSICADYCASVNPRDCVPISFLFRTFNTVKILWTIRVLKNLGFTFIRNMHSHLHWYTRHEKRPLLVIFPQFSGEFQLLSNFAKLVDKFDILFVCPLGIQCSWFQTAARHSDTLEEYLPIIDQYTKILPITWSAGNLPFQVLDRYLELTNQRHKICEIIRMDPLGYPSSNFLVYTGIPIGLFDLHARFITLCGGKITGLWNKFGCIGLTYLLKTSHGYAYLKSGRMLRGTKLSPTPYHEHHFTAKYDPLWTLGNAVFDHDRHLLCSGHVTEHKIDGFHGLWLNQSTLEKHVFPILHKYADKTA